MRSALAILVVAAIAIGENSAVASQDDSRLEALFASLKTANTTAEAASVEQQIWGIWLEVSDDQAGESLAAGVRAMQTGDAATALSAFDRVVNVAPNFAEGWNRRATLHYMLGDYPSSISDIAKTLALEPRHFGALSGLALIRAAQRRPFEALEALERVTRVHPRMPGLEDRVAQLTKQLGEAI
jgi:tetratricopeptide (TPR) repeat protein